MDADTQIVMNTVVVQSVMWDDGPQTASHPPDQAFGLIFLAVLTVYFIVAYLLVPKMVKRNKP